MQRELIATETERNALTKQLPLIKEISDSNLRNLVIEIWAKLWRESPYENITEAPNYTTELSKGNETLVRHTNAVAKMAEAIAREFQQIYGVSVNHDYLLAGSILHDVDKLVLYERQGDHIGITELGRKTTHGEYGARVAREIGLPDEVTNIIASHSPVKRETLPATIEAVLVSSCDSANFQSYRLMNGEGLFIKP